MQCEKQGESLTDYELIDDAFIRAFVMLLGVNPPRGEVKQHFIHFVRSRAEDKFKNINEDFVFSCIPAYIVHLHAKRG